MKYYSVATFDITDKTWVRDYVQHVTRMVESAGGRYLARTPNAERMEGDGKPPQFFLIIEWQSREAAMSFYEGAQYRPYREKRTEGSSGQFFMVAGEDINKVANIA